MSKNLVICLDGTGGEYGSKNTNVLLLHQMLVQDATQVAFYDPGVGTFSVQDTLTGASRFWQKVLGLAFGFGLRQNVADAYAFVMHHYQEGDRIYLYGFSRGAYTARLVAALIHGIGILPRGLESLIPYGLRYLQVDKGGLDFKRLFGFSKQFRRCKRPQNMFLGLWDTVASVSWIFDRQVYGYTTTNPSVSHARHAIAIDERRTFFPISELSEKLPAQDLKQVWFPGVHSDIGGGQPVAESGLCKVALEWMVVESQKEGLKIDDDMAFEVFEEVEPDPLGHRHESLSGPWWAAEFWPKRTWDWDRDRWSLRLNLGRRRPKPTAMIVHESMEIRRQATSYDPRDLGGELTIEPRVPFSSQDGSQSLPDWAPPAGPPGPEIKDSFSWLTPIIAALGLYGLGTLIAAPLVLLWWVMRLDLGGLLTEVALWPRWLGDRLREVLAYVLDRPEILAVLIFPVVFRVGARLLERWAPLEAARKNAAKGDHDPTLPHLRLRSSPAQTADLLKRLKTEGRDEYSRALKLDFGFMVLYGAAFWTAWRFTGPAAVAWQWPLLVMGIAIAADVVENLLLLGELSRPGESYSSFRLRLAGWATTIKLVGVAVSVVALSAELLFPGSLLSLENLLQ